MEELNNLEREHEQKELERQRRQEELELKRRQDEFELERQRQLEAEEFERQKRLLEVRAKLKAASVCGSQDANSQVGLSVNLEEEEESHCKVERWLHVKEPSVQMSTSAVMTTAVQKLADTLKDAIQPDSLRKQLPVFSGKVDEWPMFYSAYEKTVNSFSEEDNLIRLRKCLEGDAFKMVKPLFVSSKNLSSIIKTLQMRFGRPEFIIESMLQKTRALLPVRKMIPLA